MDLLFHRSLYSKKALERALEEFRETAMFSMAKRGDYWVVAVDQVSEDTSLDELIGEFENYVLGAMLEQRWQK